MATQLGQLQVDSFDGLVQQLEHRFALADTGTRQLVAVVGPPAAGKSTLAEMLGQRLDRCQVVPMDGFHLDNRLLESQGLLPRKGAPNTFDVHGLGSLLTRIRDDQGPVHVPIFDRSADLSRAAASTVSPHHRIIVVEGNYLLLDQDPWSQLHRLFDVSVALQVTEAELTERLLARWTGYGLTEDAARARAEQNDLPNGRQVLGHSIAADFVFATP